LQSNPRPPDNTSVILSEPPRTRYDLNFDLIGIPVRVHPLFWLVAVILGARGNDEPKQLLLWVATVFVSILIHELGHALAARWYGWEPWITLHGFGGLASYRPTHRTATSQILISLAGPAAGFLFATILVGLVVASGHRVAFGWPDFVLPVIFEPYKSDALNWLLIDLLYVNIFWGLVNLLPIYPLDGGQISQEVFQLANPREGLRLSLMLSIGLAVGAGALVLVKWQDTFLALFCGFLAYNCYTILQSTTGGGWGGYR
jgi:Zn-dependent protease